MHCGCIEGALEDAFVRALPGAFADALQVHSNVYFMCIICALDVHLQVHCRCQIELVKSCAGLETERLFSLVTLRDSQSGMIARLCYETCYFQLDFSHY